MENLKGILSNHMLFAPIAAWFISQLVKAFINLFVYKKFSLERLFGDGGMPSAHSATVMCLTIMIGWTVGFGSAVFALSFIFAVVVTLGELINNKHHETTIFNGIIVRDAARCSFGAIFYH